MIVNKKLDRFKQWAGERMGGEVKTNKTDEFKALEQEMELRQQGVEKMQDSMNTYMKAVSKRTELEKKEKMLPIAYLGNSMITHSEDFEHDSEFGQCLNSMSSLQWLGSVTDFEQHSVVHKNKWQELKSLTSVQLQIAGTIRWSDPLFK